MEKEKDFKIHSITKTENCWLKFDNRVLNEARDKSIPLFGTPEICQYHFLKSG